MEKVKSFIEQGIERYKWGAIALIFVSYLSFYAFSQPLWNYSAYVGSVLLLVSILSFALSYAKFKVNTIIYLSIILQVLLLWLPEAHNDYYRYMWDGWLFLNEVTPFETVPDKIGQVNNALSNVWYWDQIDFKWANTIYLGGAQIIFWLAQKISPNSLFGLRLLSVLASAGSLLLLQKLSLKKNHLERYIPFIAFSPILIFDAIISTHTEIFIVLYIFLAMLFYYSSKNYALLRNIFYAFAISVKPYVLALVSADYVEQFRKHKWTYLGYSLAIIIFSFVNINIPFLYSLGHIESFFAAMIRFNSQWVAFPAIFSVFKYIGGFGFAKLMSLALTVATFIYSYHRNKDIFSVFAYTLFVFLFSSSTLFSWYFIPLLFLLPWTKYFYRRAIWIALIIAPAQYLFVIPNSENNSFTYYQNGEIWWGQLLLWGPVFYILFDELHKNFRKKV